MTPIKSVITTGLIALISACGGGTADVPEASTTPVVVAHETPPRTLKTCSTASPTGSVQPVVTRSTETPLRYGLKNYIVSGGQLYELTSSNKRLPVAKLYDVHFVAKHFKTDNDKVFVLDQASGRNLPVCNDFQEGFENATRVQELFGSNTNWSSMTLLSPAAPTIADYVQLRQDIIEHNAPFKDNRIAVSSEQAHSGSKSLKLYAVRPALGLNLTKTSLDNERLFFKRGDRMSFSGWFYLAEGTPTSLVDIESGYMDQSPGMRLMLSEDLEPSIQLKWADKPSYRSLPNTEVRLPRQQWVKLALHFYLSEGSDGLAQLFVNDRLVINGQGQTLPLADTVYTRLEVGITANASNRNAVVYADDLRMDSVKR